MKFFYLFFLCITCFSIHHVSAQTTTSFTLTGDVWYKTGTVKLLVSTRKSTFVSFDSTEIKDGHFFFSHTLDEPKLFSLQYGTENRLLFLGNEHVVVTETDSITKKVTVTGSPLTADYDYYFARWLQPLIDRLRNVNKAIAGLDSSHQQELDSLNHIQSPLFTHVPDSTITFIREHPNSFVSLYLLNYYGDAYNVILMNSLYKFLNNTLKQYPSADFIKQKIEFGLHQSARCPPFSVSDSNHQPVTLQTFRGQYLLINFWASWCVPCIKELPYLQKAAARFIHQHVQILTASLDTDSTAWKAALSRYHLKENCRNIFLDNQFRNPMALQFNLSFIPYNLLVDPEGNIVARNIEGEDLIYKIETILASRKE